MVNLTEKTFREEVLNANEIVIVDFWAPWCGPCRMVAPVLEQIAAESTGKVKIAKVNVDENPELNSQFNVMSIPKMVIFKQGRIVDEFVGALPKTAIEKKLAPWIN